MPVFSVTIWLQDDIWEDPSSFHSDPLSAHERSLGFAERNSKLYGLQKTQKAKQKIEQPQIITKAPLEEVGN